MDKVYVVIFEEGDYGSVRGFDSDAEAEAFQEGVGFGAGLYGGSGCTTYRWPSEREEMERSERAAEIQKAREAIHGMGGPAAPFVGDGH